MKKSVTLGLSHLTVTLALIFCMSAASAQRTSDPSGAVQGELWQFRDYTSQHISSYDTTGANDDGNWKDKIKPGETRTIGNVTGPGIIKHMWFTIASNEHNHLKKIVIRIYWEGNSTPSVEAPIGDFFGLGLSKYFLYESKYLSVGSQRALNCYFPMPFRKSAKI